MKKETRSLFDYLINLGFIIYFVLLFVERTLSFVLTVINKEQGWSYIYGGNHLVSYMYTLIIISFVGAVFLLIFKCRKAFVKIFKKDTENCFVPLSFASGIFLFSGMVHTEHTIPGLQFTAYGFLIASILLQTIIYVYEKKDTMFSWIVFAYLCAISMAIPVVYQTELNNKLAFEIFESTGSFIAVLSFTYLLCLFFSYDVEQDKMFALPPFLAIEGFDLIILSWRWKDTYPLAKDANTFVLMFAVISVVLFIIGCLLKNVQKVKAEEEKK